MKAFVAVVALAFVLVVLDQGLAAPPDLPKVPDLPQVPGITRMLGQRVQRAASPQGHQHTASCMGNRAGTATTTEAPEDV